MPAQIYTKVVIPEGLTASEIQTAITDGITNGAGIFEFEAGSYELDASVAFTLPTDRSLAFHCAGAVFTVPENTIGFQITGGSTNGNLHQPVSIHNLWITGDDNTGTTGLKVIGVNNLTLYDVHVEKCTTSGIEMNAPDSAVTTNWSEGLGIFKGSLWDNKIGLLFSNGGNGGSFANPTIAGLRVFIGSGNTSGIQVDEDSNIYGGFISASIHTHENSTGFLLNGSANGTTMILEGEIQGTASTGQDFLTVGANATNMPKADIRIHVVAPSNWNAVVTDNTSAGFAYQLIVNQNYEFVGTAAAVRPMAWSQDGDSFPRAEVRTNLSGGGGIQMGDGTEDPDTFIGRVVNSTVPGMAIFLDGVSNEYLRVQESIGSEQTGLFIRVDNGTVQLERVTLGATDSGGSGFKLLRVPNS